MFGRIGRVFSLLVLGTLLLVACSDLVSNAPTPTAQQPTRVVATQAPTLTVAPTGVPAETLVPTTQAIASTRTPELDRTAAGSKPDYPGIWGIWGGGVS